MNGRLNDTMCLFLSLFLLQSNEEEEEEERVLFLHGMRRNESRPSSVSFPIQGLNK